MPAEPGGEPNNALNRDFRDFIHELNTQLVECVLVGGYAVGAYGVIRATSDIDFFYRRSPDNVERLCNALVSFGAPPVVIDRATLLTPGSVVMFGAPPRRIDLLSDLTGVDFDLVWSASSRIELDGLPLQLISLHDLMANKAATGRAKDKADVTQLKRVRRMG
jgi:predicted nucleotidyltransferase